MFSVAIVCKDASASSLPAGKIAAQCCHATLAVYQSLEGRHHNVLRQWEAEGQKKIALKCKTGAQLAVLAATAGPHPSTSYDERSGIRVHGAVYHGVGCRV